MERGTETLKGFADFANKRIQEAIPHVKNYVGFAEEKVKESLPIVKGFAEEKMKASLPLAKDSVGFAKEKVKESVHHVEGFLLEKLNLFIPDFFKIAMFFPVNHPYLFGCLVLFVYWKSSRSCRGHRRSSGDDHSGGKMMKAPGRDDRIPRTGFEENPRSYFRGLRGKSDQVELQRTMSLNECVVASQKTINSIAS